ncbi:hypothetical protein D9M68_958430 [compost metagenome]
MDNRPHQQALALCAQVDLLADVQCLGEQCLGLLVGDKLDASHQPLAANIADQRQLGEALQALLQVGADVLDVGQQAFAFDDLDVLQRGNAAHRMAAVGEAVGEAAATAGLADHLPDAFGENAGAQR